MAVHRWTPGLQGPASSLRTYLTPAALVFGNCCLMHDEGPWGFPGEVIRPHIDPPTTEHSRAQDALIPSWPPAADLPNAWTCLPGLCVTSPTPFCAVKGGNSFVTAQCKQASCLLQSPAGCVCHFLQMLVAACYLGI